MIKFQRILVFLQLILITQSYSQNTAIGQWRVHLPFNKARFVADGGNKIYCAAEDGLFSYNKDDNSIETFSKINGLSDIGISVMGYYGEKNLLLVGYENANLDLIFSNEIINIADIKRKNILGTKSINAVNFFGNFAYLACGFGIVVIDIDRREIKDTYYIGPNGNNINVAGIANDGNNLFATTDSGVYAISIYDPNINFYGAWNNILNNTPGETLSKTVFFNNKIYVKDDTQSNFDYVKIYENGSWTNGPGMSDIRSLQSVNNRLVITGLDSLLVFDQNTIIKIYGKSVYNCSMFDGVCDQNNIVWVADNQKGIAKISSSTYVEFLLPDGPHSKLSAGMQFLNGQLWVGHSVTGAKWDNYFSDFKFSGKKRCPGSDFNNDVSLIISEEKE